MSNFWQLSNQELWEKVHSDDTLDKIEAANELHRRLDRNGEHERALTVATSII